MGSGISVYGVDQCEDTQRTMRHLDELGADFRYVNLDRDSESDRFVKEHNGGRRITPTVVIAAAGYRRILAEPDNDELDFELDRAHLLPHGWEADHQTSHHSRKRGRKSA